MPKYRIVRGYTADIEESLEVEAASPEEAVRVTMEMVESDTPIAWHLDGIEVHEGSEAYDLFENDRFLAKFEDLIQDAVREELEAELEAE